MTTLFLKLYIDCNHPARFSVQHSTGRKDSITKSLFQRVGLAYKTHDLIANRVAANPYAAKCSLFTDLLNLGFSSEQSEILLNAKGWGMRMELTWMFIKPTERVRAQDLDYAEYENYWESLSFTNPAWRSNSKNTSGSA